ncbi:C40 family peptidase [Actinoplanes hulinensis]|uniref:C40 family peptidase n=1 Tax=Actinoplanes hulinensis TaxID=1144547 RepID=UPI0027E26395|nr:NlpC/P60 family protein [Actinoplanes hulinensis]
MCSAAVAAAIAALFQPIPAMADPVSVTGSTSVPDAGARPPHLASLVLPGAQTASPTPTTPSLITPGVVASPVIQKVEKGRAEIAALGDQLIRLGQDRDLAQTHLTAAAQRVTETQQAAAQAKTIAAEAAAATMQEAAALPPGALDSGLLDLDALSRMQRGDATSYEAAASRLAAAEAAVKTATEEHLLAGNRHSSLSAQWTSLNTQIGRKQAAQKKYEDEHRDEISAAESTANAADQQLGAEYLAGSQEGRDADPRAVKALEFALAQRGDPYVWSEEGPDRYDCSGLMYAAYRSTNYPLVRVSRDQYYQTRDRVVSRYSLLPGDLLFFSSSSSWTGIHHVAMYAGEGMMVEAPRTGLNVRLTPVRWSRLFAATRVYGSIEGDTETPDLGAPDPDEPATSPSPSSTTSKPPTSPSSSPSSSKTPKPSSSSSTSPSASPSTSTSPSTSPSPSASPSPSPTPNPSDSTIPVTTPTPGESGSSSSAAATSSSAGSASVTSASKTAATSDSKSISPSASKSASPSASSSD